MLFKYKSKQKWEVVISYLSCRHLNFLEDIFSIVQYRASLNGDKWDISKYYSCLVDLVDACENTSYYMSKALENVDFGSDSCDLKKYLDKRVAGKTDLSDIMNSYICKVQRDNISQSLYLLLQNCQATSVSVERIFSMLNKLLVKERNFLLKIYQIFFHYIIIP